MAPTPNMTTLLSIAGSLGLGIGVMTLLIDRERNNLVQQAPFVTKAIELMNQQPEIRRILGDKLQVGKPTFRDGWGKMTRDHVRLRVPIKGENDSAFLFAYARKKHEKAKLRLYKLEATFGKIEGKKLIILDRTDEEDEPDEEELKELEKQRQQALDAAKKVDRKQLDKEMMKSWKQKE